jgi:diamine N-acetyltransferase
MEIRGRNIKLRPATLADRRKIFEGLTRSDITPSMMGPPDYPDHPIPSWEEFKEDYRPSYFEEHTDTPGKNFIILAGTAEVGTIGYDNLDWQKGSVDLDIWMRAEEYCGCGYGTDAVDSLVNYLHSTYGVNEFRVDPSARNTRAIHAYRKSGFSEIDQKGPVRGHDYRDTLIMVKRK